MPSEKIFNVEAENMKEEILAQGKIKPMSVLAKIAEVETEKMSEVEKEESKGDKFKRLVQIRVTRILDDIDILGNLSTANYEYTPEQIDKVFTAIVNELTITRQKFLNHNTLRFTL